MVDESLSILAVAEAGNGKPGTGEVVIPARLIERGTTYVPPGKAN